MEKKKPKAEYSSRTNSLLVYTKKYTFKVCKEKRLAYEPLCGHLLLRKSIVYPTLSLL